MKVNYDPWSDILYLIVKEGPIFDSKELDEDVRIECNKEGQISGIEILNSRNNIFKVAATEIAQRLEASDE
jgi:uncharacterized protein YuzE